MTAAADAGGLWETDLPGLPPPRRGKVRDVYDLGDALLIVATDRLSAYDHVLRPAIPGKGKILTQLSSFWFRELAGAVPHHLLETDADRFPPALLPHRALHRREVAVLVVSRLRLGRRGEDRLGQAAGAR